MSPTPTNQLEQFDFRRWYDEIDDFVTDTAQQLNQINRRLGELRSHGPTISRSSSQSEAEPAEELDPNASTSDERLQSLRNRLQARLQGNGTANEPGQPGTVERNGHSDNR